MTPGHPGGDVIAASPARGTRGRGSTRSSTMSKADQADGDGRPARRPSRASATWSSSSRRRLDAATRQRDPHATCARRTSACRWSRTPSPSGCSREIGIELGRRVWAGPTLRRLGRRQRQGAEQGRRRPRSSRRTRSSRTRSRSRRPSPKGSRSPFEQALKMPTRPGGDRRDRRR